MGARHTEQSEVYEKASEVGDCWSKTGNGTYRTRSLIWLQFVSVSANKIFPAGTLFADTVTKLADQKQEMEHIERNVWFDYSLGVYPRKSSSPKLLYLQIRSSKK